MSQKGCFRKGGVSICTDNDFNGMQPQCFGICFIPEGLLLNWNVHSAYGNALARGFALLLDGIGLVVVGACRDGEQCFGVFFWDNQNCSELYSLNFISNSLAKKFWQFIFEK